MSAQPITNTQEDHAADTYHSIKHVDETQIIELDFERVSHRQENTPVKVKTQSLTDWLKSRWYDIGVVLLFFTCVVTVARCLGGIQSF